MGYFKEKMRKFINWATSDDYAPEEPWKLPSISLMGSAINSSKASTMNSGAIEGCNGLNFTVYSAYGGKVIQIRSYDMITDRSRSELYVITDKEDLGAEIGMIITRESLSR
jgi:hypothetical protein